MLLISLYLFLSIIGLGIFYKTKSIKLFVGFYVVTIILFSLVYWMVYGV